MILERPGRRASVPVPLAQAATISSRATELAKRRAPKYTGQGASRLTPVRRPGMVGVRTPDEYMMHQERGIRPFVMHALAGKAQPLNEDILTPNGWRKMGDLNLGDKIIGSNGCSTIITGIYPQGEIDCFYIRFSDDTYVRCSEDHLWQVRYTSGGRDKNYRDRRQVRTTEYLASRLNARWVVDLVDPVQYVSVKLPIDSYLLGIIISEGCRGSSPTISQQSMEVIQEIKQVIPKGLELKKNNKNYSWYIVSGARGTNKNILSQKLRDIGIHNLYAQEKFIPPIYLYASVEDRLALLQGLMDGDGDCPKQGSLRYSTSSRRLAQDICELVRSLGGISKVNGPYRDTEYIVKILLQEGMIPFRAYLKNKLFRYQNTKRRFATGKKIKSINYDGVEDMQCISVEAEDNLYVTSNFTLTHNTIPIRTPSGDIVFRRATAENIGRRRITARDELGRIVRTKISWRHPGLDPKRYMEKSVDQAIEEWLEETGNHEVARILMEHHDLDISQLLTLRMR